MDICQSPGREGSDHNPEWKLETETFAGSLTLMLTGLGGLAGYVTLQWRARRKD